MFELALDQDPRDVNSLNSLALILQHQGQHVEAQGYMSKALRLAPAECALHCNYGSFLQSVRKGKAGVWCGRVQQEDARPSQVLAFPTFELMEAMRSREACRQGRRLGAWPSDRPLADVCVGAARVIETPCTCVREAEHDAAEYHYRRALSLNPDHLQTLCCYSSFLRTIRQDYEARAPSPPSSSSHSSPRPRPRPLRPRPRVPSEIRCCYARPDTLCGPALGT